MRNGVIRGAALASLVALFALATPLTANASDGAPATVASARPATWQGAPATATATDNPATIDWSSVESGNCLVIKNGWGFKSCNRGDPNGYWRVAFIGDSHMRQYFATLDILAKRYHWQVSYISKSACTVANWKMFPHNRAEPSCWDWNQKLAGFLSKSRPYDLIVNSNSSLVSMNDPKMAAAYRSVVASQLQRGTKWLVISDNPKPTLTFQSCIAANGNRAGVVCALPYQTAMTPADALPAAVRNLNGVTVADFRSKFCPNQCPPVINGVVVYRDASHLTSKFAQSLLPEVDAAIPDRFKHKPVPTMQFAPIATVETLVRLSL